MGGVGLRLASLATIKIEFSNSPLCLNARMMAHKVARVQQAPCTVAACSSRAMHKSTPLQDTQRLQLSMHFGALIVL